jgi:hypothetical protein
LLSISAKCAIFLTPKCYYNTIFYKMKGHIYEVQLPAFL